MRLDVQDTIVALSSAAGCGGRAIVRLSGPAALAIVNRLFVAERPIAPDQRQRYPGSLRLAELSAPLPADFYVWPGPRSYTGQDLLELHTLASPPLVDLLIAQLLTAGARAAQPGEFTLRAFLAGKLDLPRAEAVLGVIEAGSRDELRQALGQLAGGLTRPLQDVREDLLNLLADVEAGLDFADEDIRFVEERETLLRLGKALAMLTLAQKNLAQRSVSDRCFRVVLAGRPNAGKSSLFNALAGAAAALVSPEPGTTRDYLVHRLDLDGVTVELLDTAGWREAAGVVEQQAQSLGQAQAAEADCLLLCLEAGQPPSASEMRLLIQAAPPVLGVATKCDRAEPLAGMVTTSAATGSGLEALRTLLAEKARSHGRSGLAPSVSRCRHHVDACLACLRRAHGVVLFEEPVEILALELRSTLDELGELVGAVYSDDLLDRIFSRFCIGK